MCLTSSSLAAHEGTLSRFKHDLHNAIQNLLHAEALAEGMAHLRDTYGMEDKSTAGPNEVKGGGCVCVERGVCVCVGKGEFVSVCACAV